VKRDSVWRATPTEARRACAGNPLWLAALLAPALMGATLLGPPPGKFSGRLAKPYFCAVTTQYLPPLATAGPEQLIQDHRAIELPAGTRVRWLSMEQPLAWWYSATYVRVIAGSYKGARCYIAGTGPLVK
jgi:hypothetical protein